MPVRRTPLRALVAAAVCALVPLATLALPGGSPAAEAAGRKVTRKATATGPLTYWVDPVAGSDRAKGTTRTAPWRSLTRVSSAPLRAGDTVLLRAGVRHVGALVLTAHGTATKPITVSRYGVGTRPLVTGTATGTACVTLRGAWTTVSGVAAVGCGGAGFSVEGAHDTVRDVEASGSVRGVWVRTGSTYATVRDSHLHDNDLMAPGTTGGDDDHGAQGVDVNGDHARITGNLITGHLAPSADYGEDGAAVEVYDAIGTVVDHNRAVDNLAFTELGGRRTTGTRVAYNSVTSSLRDGSFLMTRGAGQVWGPVLDTVAEHNSVLLTGARSFGFGCYGGCTPQILDLRDNIIVAGWYAGWADGTFGSSGNLYRGEIWFPLAPTDSTADPQFVAPALGDLRLATTSPAVDRVSAPESWLTDLDGGAVPVDGDGDGVARADLGAYELR